jgi:hypothetical protein
VPGPASAGVVPGVCPGGAAVLSRARSRLLDLELEPIIDRSQLGALVRTELQVTEELGRK